MVKIYVNVCVFSCLCVHYVCVICYIWKQIGTYIDINGISYLFVDLGVWKGGGGSERGAGARC